MISIPVPDTLEAVTLLIIGFQLSRSFSKKLDQSIQSTPTFKAQSPVIKWFIKSLLDFTHHYWVGLLIMAYRPDFYWFGLGLFLDDLPDLPRRFRAMFSIPVDLTEPAQPPQEPST
jgi:hypothetical protein